MLYSTIHHHQQGECARYCMEQRTCHQLDHTFVSTFTFLFIFIGVPSGSHCLIQLLKVKIFNCHISIRLNCSINFCTWTAAFKETKSKSSWMKCPKGGGKKGRHRCPLRGDRCYRFIHIDSTAVLVYRAWPRLLCCQALRYNRMPVFFFFFIVERHAAN